MQITITKINGDTVSIELPYYCTNGFHLSKILDSETCLYITPGTENIHPSVGKNFASLMFESGTPTQITKTEFDTKLQEIKNQIFN